jgi:hypothetical protein
MALSIAQDMAQLGANVLKLFCLFLDSFYRNASLPYSGTPDRLCPSQQTLD